MTIDGGTIDGHFYLKYSYTVIREIRYNNQ